MPAALDKRIGCVKICRKGLHTYVISNAKRCSECQKEYQKLNKEKRNKKSLDNYYENLDHYRELNKERQQNLTEKQKEKRREQAKKYRQTPQAIKYAKEYRANYILTEHGRQVIRHHNRLRKDRNRGAEGSHTLKEWEDLKASCNYQCNHCKKNKPLTRDHIIPITRGGSNYIANIQPLCRECNASKGYSCPKDQIF